MSRAQDPDIRIGCPAQITQLRYQGMILCQRHVCYYSERGDLLKDRFGLMMKNDGFHVQRPLDKSKWTSEKQIRCADAQRWLSNDSQSSFAFLQKLSSKSNNARREEAGQERANIFMAMAIFFCHVLKILTSDLDSPLK